MKALLAQRMFLLVGFEGLPLEELQLRGILQMVRMNCQLVLQLHLFEFPFLPEFPADLDGSAVVSAFLSRNGGGPSTSITNQVTAADNGFLDWTVPGNTLTPGTYTLDCQVRFRDPNITTSFGGTASFTDVGFLTLT